MEFHEYRLRSQAVLNPLAPRREFPGALLRAYGGHGCIHPWPELGDASLEEELTRLRRGHPGPLGKRALQCCRIDGEARREGKSLWTGLVVPKSHFTMGSETAIPPGFATVKIKGGGDPSLLSERIKSLPAHLGIRIDCNGVLLGVAQFVELWTELAPWHQRIEFVEDPCPFAESVWREIADLTGCSLALDRWDGVAPDHWIRVVKPALQGEWRGNGSLVFTSSMDHPVGQLFAAWCAAREAAVRPERVLACGLVTHHLFDPADPFVDALGPPQPVLKPPVGTGLGFDDLLEELPWERVC